MAMTPLQINTAARQRYNAVGDDFWSDAEIYLTIYQACSELATEGFVIEQSYSTTSVVSQQGYSLPTNAMSIKRVTYNGQKLMPYDMREDDVLTVLNQAVTSTGTPTNYFVWNRTIYMRPVPDTVALPIIVYSHIHPQAITATTTIEIPTELEMSLLYFVLAEMSAKNKNYVGQASYLNLWVGAKKNAKELQRKKKIADGFNVVKNVDVMFQDDFGNL